MASSETILAWKAELQGAESVKDGLRKINEEVKKGGLTQTEANRVIQSATKDTRNFRAEQNLLTRSFMSAHPQLNTLTRAMSTFGNIARTGLNIANSLNLMWMRQSMTGTAVADATYELAKAQRELTLAEKTNDPLKIAEAMEKVAIMTARLTEENKKASAQFWTDAITTVNAITMIVNSSVELGIKALPQIKDFITGLKGLTSAKVLDSLKNLGTGFADMFGKLAGGNTKRAIGGIVALGAGMGLLATGGMDALIGKSEKVEDKLKALGGIGAIGVGIALEVPEIAKIALIGTAIIVAITAIILFRKEIGDAFTYIAKYINTETISKFFTESIPNAITGAGQSIYKFFVTDLPLWAGEAWTSISTALSPLLEFFNSIFGPIINLFTELITKSEEDGGFFVAIWDGIKESISGVWTIITEQFVGFWNTLVSTMNNAGTSLTSGVNSVFGGMIAALNSLIRSYNTAAKKIGKPTVSTVSFSPISYTALASIPMPTIKAATGFDGMVNRPTMFLAGEAGPEQVSVTPNGRTGGGGGITVVVNVQGSILTERELFRRVDENLKNELKRRNFRLLQ